MKEGARPGIEPITYMALKEPYSPCFNAKAITSVGQYSFIDRDARYMFFSSVSSEATDAAEFQHEQKWLSQLDIPI